MSVAVLTYLHAFKLRRRPRAVTSVMAVTGPGSFALIINKRRHCVLASVFAAVDDEEVQADNDDNGSQLVSSYGPWLQS